MDASSALAALEAEAEAQVAALEREMEEITGEIPSSDNTMVEAVEVQNQEEEEETQILGDLDVDNDTQCLTGTRVDMEGGEENDPEGGTDGHERNSNAIIKQERIVDKFVLENENESEGRIVYYVVENPGDGTEYSIQGENHSQAETEVMDFEDSQQEEAGEETGDAGNFSNSVAEDTIDPVENNIPCESKQNVIVLEDMDISVNMNTEETFASAGKFPSRVPVSSAQSVSVGSKIPKLEPGLSQVTMTNSSSSIENPLAPDDLGDYTNELNPLWELDGCIICNEKMRIDDPENLILTNVELKDFYAKMLGLGEGLQLDQETTYPFCPSCTEDVTQLKSIAHKIDFMHRQFDKMRDNLARKTVKTFLLRKEPELMKREEIERRRNPTAETKVSLKDIIYNRWKSRYDLNFPGPQCPLIIKTMDSRGRTTVVRMSQHEGKEVLKHIPVARCSNRSVKEMRRIPVLKIDEGQESSGTDLPRNEYKCELPFECELCGKGFAVPHYLMIHMRSHTGEKPYKCEVCGKGFAQRGGLVTHNLVHSGDKPFECTQCGKSFRQKYHLTQHLLIHSGAKPFGCDICGKFFNVKMNLREHMRRHTGDRPYKCPYCLIIGFFRKKMLRDHIIKAHPSKKLPGELESVTDTKPSIRGLSDASIEENAAKRARRTVNIKTESSSETEADYPSPTPSPSQDEEESLDRLELLAEGGQVE